MPITTAAEAVAAWDSGQPLTVVKIGPAGPLKSGTANQSMLWGRVMDMLRKFPPEAPAGETSQHVIAGRTGTSVVDSRGIFTFAQFESWCWHNEIGFLDFWYRHNEIGFLDFARPADADAKTGAMQWEAQDDGGWSPARQMAYSILREGFQFVIDRRRATDPGSAVFVRKGAANAKQG